MLRSRRPRGLPSLRQHGLVPVAAELRERRDVERTADAYHAKLAEDRVQQSAVHPHAAVARGSASYTQIIIVGLLLVILGIGLVMNFGPRSDSLAENSSCGDWRAATSDQRRDFVKSDGYYSDARLRVTELNRLCRLHTAEVTLGALDEMH